MSRMRRLVNAYARYIAVPWQKVIPAQGISPRDCALIEPMSVGFHAVDRGAVTDIDTLADLALAEHQPIGGSPGADHVDGCLPRTPVM